MTIEILIADDAPFIREIVKQVFKSTDVKIIGEASDGEEVVKLAKAKKPQIILMDLVMPKKSGIEATKEIRELLPSIKIIAFTTIDQNSMVLKALEAGCCDYVTKPFKSEDLIKAVHSAAEKIHQGG